MGYVPNIDTDLHPALPIRQRLDDEFMLVMSGEVGTIVFQSVYDKVTFLGRKESGGSRVLPTSRPPPKRQETERRSRCKGEGTYVVHDEIRNAGHDDCSQTLPSKPEKQ